MDFNEFAKTDPVQLFDELNKTQGKLFKRDTKIREQGRTIDKLRQDLANAEEDLSGVELLRDLAGVDVPAWLTSDKADREHRATPFLVLSDLHLDEIVSAAEMDNLNSYTRSIAEDRFQRVIDGTIELCSTYVSGLEFDGIVVALVGDIITGIIHEELAETNEATVPETIMHWTPIIASALKRLADHFGHVFVPCVDGNHDRTHKKIRMKKRAVSSNAWIIYNSLALLTADDDRIEFAITKSPEYRFDIYGTRFLLDHGDKFRGGGGVGGIYPPMLKWLTRKMNIPGRGFDIAVIGHWHQLIYHSNIFVNGSLKGYDEYARGMAFGFERPQQLLFFVTPENGVTMKTQVFADSEDEEWTN